MVMAAPQDQESRQQSQQHRKELHPEAGLFAPHPAATVMSSNPFWLNHTTPYPSDSLEIPQWCPVLVAPFEGSPKQSTGMECVVKMEEPQMMQG